MESGLDDTGYVVVWGLAAELWVYIVPGQVLNLNCTDNFAFQPERGFIIVSHFYMTFIFIHESFTGISIVMIKLLHFTTKKHTIRTLLRMNECNVK